MSDKDNVEKIYPVHALRNPDKLLELCKGDFESLCVIGVNKSGALTARATDTMTVAELIFYMEQVKAILLDGRDDDDDDDDEDDE